MWVIVVDRRITFNKDIKSMKIVGISVNQLQ